VALSSGQSISQQEHHDMQVRGDEKQLMPFVDDMGNVLCFNGEWKHRARSERACIALYHKLISWNALITKTVLLCWFRDSRLAQLSSLRYTTCPFVSLVLITCKAM
jgi:hypothetical protein